MNALNNRQLVVSIPEDMMKKIDDIAEKEQRNRSQMVRILLVKVLQEMS
jgi:metal-responsive CopG/Arc/MetJ family transcriptional regulator